MIALLLVIRLPSTNISATTPSGRDMTWVIGMNRILHTITVLWLRTLSMCNATTSQSPGFSKIEMSSTPSDWIRITQRRNLIISTPRNISISQIQFLTPKFKSNLSFYVCSFRFKLSHIWIVAVDREFCACCICPCKFRRTKNGSPRPDRTRAQFPTPRLWNLAWLLMYGLNVICENVTRTGNRPVLWWDHCYRQDEWYGMCHR